MYVRKLVFGTAFAIFSMACIAPSADAADFQALHGAAATPMTSAQMDAVQGKAVVAKMFSLDSVTPRSNAAFLSATFNGTSYSNHTTNNGPIFHKSYGAGDSQFTINYLVGGGARR